MKWRLPNSLSLSFGLVVLACSDSPIDVQVPTNFAEAIKLYSDQEWVLTYAIVSDSIVNLTRYQPFGMSFNDSTIYGSDGCNLYHARFQIVGDSVHIPVAGGTSVGCAGTSEFDYNQFENHWRVIPTRTIIVFRSRHTILTFTAIQPSIE
jgi:hypothetical protein